MATYLIQRLGVAVSIWVMAITGAAAGSATPDLLRGKYLTVAGDCVPCHTAPGGKPLAGGRAIGTPFGTIYSPNITPDRETGIGAWSLDDFTRAMKEGVNAHGSRLYPAFPYPYYTRVKGDDIRAIYAYLFALEPVRATPPPNELIWPLNHRVFVRGWNLLFFSAGDYKDNPAKSAQWNRGAYLVEGLGHCGACHTPKNSLGGDRTSKAFKGNTIHAWVAPNLTSDAMKGLRAWSADDIVEYLKTGKNSYAQTGGPMGEVVSYSTSRMTMADLRAIAAYLKDLPGAAENPAPRTVSGSIMKAGEAIYNDQCSACHQTSGQGISYLFPALAGGGVSVQDDPSSTINVILRGASTVPSDRKPTAPGMPAYGWKLTDGEIADVATYVRNSWGNSAPAVSASQVKSLREKLHAQAE